MDPVKVGPNLDVIDMKAAGIIPFGAAVVWSAAGTVKAAITANDHDIIGIADMSEVEKDVPGFYATYDPVPVVIDKGGRVNLWVVVNGGTHNIVAGDFLEIADLGDSPTGTHGIWEEAASTDGTAYQVDARAQAMEDVTMGTNSKQIPDDVAIGDTTITFSSATTLTNLAVVAGSFILLEDILTSGDLQVNRVKSLTSTVITLEKASTVDLSNSASDLVSKMFQCEAILL